MVSKTANQNVPTNGGVRLIVLHTDATTASQLIKDMINSDSFARLETLASSPDVATVNSGLSAAGDRTPVVQAATQSIAGFAAKKTSNGVAKRRVRTPSILELGLNTGKVPFAKYYQQRNPDSHSQRYLVIAAFLKEHKKLDELTDDHIYTCYRTLNLNAVPDIGGPFRKCKRQGWFNSGSKPGWYAINHVGLGKVNNPAQA